MIRIMLIAVLFCCFACDESPVKPANPEEMKGLGFYFLKDESLKVYDITHIDMDEMELDSVPWLSDSLIRYYDWSSHIVYLKEDKTILEKYLEYEDVKGRPYMSYKPYVVTVGEERCYYGYFVDGLAFPVISTPVVLLERNLYLYPKDVFLVDGLFRFSEDRRNHPVLKDYLIQSGLYRGGVECDFDSAFPVSVYYTADKSSTIIEYSIKVKNMDSEYLYVPDPAKMENNFAPSLKNLYTELIYYNQRVGYAFEFDPEPYVRLAPGETMYRLLRDTCLFVPSGDYVVVAEYGNPPYKNLEREVRETDAGRYWMGVTKSKLWKLTIGEDGGIGKKKYRLKKIIENANGFL